MTQIQTNELRKEGFSVVKTWHIILLIVAMFVGVGITYGIGITKLEMLDLRVNKIEEWRDGHQKATEEIRRDIDVKLYELQLNLQTLMEKNGLKYQKVK